jgi:hypothetical protein
VAAATSSAWHDSVSILAPSKENSMNVQQALSNPFGVTVFGSAVIRVEPDVASLQFSVSRLEQHPKEAFDMAREGAVSVTAFLAQAELDDVGSSHITLKQTYRYVQGENQLIGYTATIAYHVLLRDLKRVEEILVGVTYAGANEIQAVDYQTSRLKALRVEARQRAVSAAREKAEIYCQAAGVTLGPVIHIEDVNPDLLRQREGHMLTEPKLDEDGPLQAFDPGSITVGGAVMVAFELVLV